MVRDIDRAEEEEGAREALDAAEGGARDAREVRDALEATDSAGVRWDAPGLREAPDTTVWEVWEPGGRGVRDPLPETTDGVQDDMESLSKPALDLELTDAGPRKPQTEFESPGARVEATEEGAREDLDEREDREAMEEAMEGAPEKKLIWLGAEGW